MPTLTIVHPCIGREKGQTDYIGSWQMQPLAPAVLAALTPKSWDIRFYDDRLEKIPFDQETDLVAMSIETYTAKRCYQIASSFRQRGIPVIMGGFHATLVPDEVAQYAEAICIGEAEGVWPVMLEDFQKGQLKKVYKATKRPDLADTQIDRSIFEGKKYLDIGLVEAGRGCHFKCEFCAIQSYFNSSQKRRPPEDVIQELKDMEEDIIFFVDDNITSNPRQAKEFFKQMKGLNKKWVGQASINVAYDLEFLQILKESGCFGLLIGFETLNEKNLISMNKRFNSMKEGFVGAIKNLRNYGIRLYPTFIFGYPDDDKQAFEKTIQFSLRQRFLITSFNHLTPFPGTPLYDRLEENDELLYDKWWMDSSYRYGDVPVKSKHLSQQEIRDLCVEARKQFYSWRSILRRMIDPWNVRDFFSLRAFFVLNMMFRREIDQRTGFPLGDEGWQGELLKAPEAKPHQEQLITIK